VAALTFAEARRVVLDRVLREQPPAAETVPLDAAPGRVLAEPLMAERDSPPLNRSMRDGFALHAADLPGRVEIIGTVAAGGIFTGTVGRGQTVEIMTGAPVPAGADAVVMIEHCHAGDGWMECRRTAEPGQNINKRGVDSRSGDLLLSPGVRIRPQEIALLASNGRAAVSVFRRPRVAIVATGDELVSLDGRPEPHQIRNSNSYALAAQVTLAGGEAWVLPVARDTVSSTLPLIEQALEADLMLLSGGVSAGKFDVVKLALGEAGAEFHFDRVLIQPGQPLVFGHARGKPFFGLPGNPASTLVCFEVFVRPALDLLSGATGALLRLTWARLAVDYKHKAGLTRFLPARLRADGRLEPVQWSGSGDIPALARGNCFLVADADKPVYEAGDWIQVLNA
jgi:molybdopterin molybdotransferase